MNMLIPQSGRVLGEVVNAFDLRRFDAKQSLSATPARDYFAGRPSTDSTKRLVYRAIAEAIASADLLPEDARWRIHLETPGLPTQGRLDVAAGLLQVIADGLDQLSGALERSTAPIAYPLHFRDAFVRLVTVDLSVRLASVLWLSGWTSTRALPTCWFDEQGLSLWLRERFAEWYPGQSRDALAMRFDVDEKTVDGWLDDEVPPLDKNLQAIAGDGAHARSRLRTLRLVYALRRLHTRLLETHGSQETTSAAMRLCWFSVGMLELVEHSRAGAAANERALTMAFASGTAGFGGPPLPWVQDMLKPIRRAEPDPVWTTTIVAATAAWLNHLQWVASRLGPSIPDELGQLGINEDEAEPILRARLASDGVLGEIPGFEAVHYAFAEMGGELGSQLLKERGSAQVFQGKLLEAIDSFRRSAEANPLDHEAHYRLGAALWQIHDVDAAFVELEIANRLAPKWDRPVVEIAILLLNLERETEAVERLLHAREEGVEQTGWFLFNLGYALERCGRHQESATIYEQCLEIAPTHGEVLDRLAHLQFLLGKKRLAARTAKKANALGFPTVFRAWGSRYYKGKGPWKRPPQLLPYDRVHATDRPWIPRPPGGDPAGAE